MLKIRRFVCNYREMPVNIRDIDYMCVQYIYMTCPYALHRRSWDFFTECEYDVRSLTKMVSECMTWSKIEQLYALIHAFPNLNTNSVNWAIHIAYQTVCTRPSGTVNMSRISNSHTEVHTPKYNTNVPWHSVRHMYPSRTLSFKWTLPYDPGPSQVQTDLSIDCTDY